MKPQEIKRVIEAKTIEFRVALDEEKSKEAIDLYWQIKQLRLSLLQLN